MPLIKRNQPLPHKSAEGSQSVSDAMAYAMEVKAEYKELERGYRKGRYKFSGNALKSYRIFLGDETEEKALFGQENIVRLRQKPPPLKETSLVLLYYLTDAQSEPERNKAGKYARIVDFMDKQGVEDDEAAEYIQKAGGIEELLKEARKGQALKTAERGGRGRCRVCRGRRGAR